MARISTIDALIWVCKLKKKGITQFEYSELPEELRSVKLIIRAKEEGLIIKTKRNGLEVKNNGLEVKKNGLKTKKNGTRANIWRISDNVECCKDKI